jgi:hypothetical protein
MNRMICLSVSREPAGADIKRGRRLPPGLCYTCTGLNLPPLDGVVALATAVVRGGHGHQRGYSEVAHGDRNAGHIVTGDLGAAQAGDDGNGDGGGEDLERVGFHVWYSFRVLVGRMFWLWPEYTA